MQCRLAWRFGAVQKFAQPGRWVGWFEKSGVVVEVVGSGTGVTLTMFTIRRPPAEIFGAPTKYKIFTVF